MDRFDRKLKAMAHRESSALPSQIEEVISRTLTELPDKPLSQSSCKPTAALRCPASAVAFAEPARQKRFSRLAVSVAAFFLIFVITPNVSREAAAAMEDIPILGELVRVVTLRNYTYCDEYHHADVHTPQVELPSDLSDTLKDSVNTINQNVQTLTNRLIEKFETDMAMYGDSAHSDIGSQYRVITDSDTWFTLEIMIYYGSGSGSVQYKYYHIDKTTGKIAVLSDLFREETDYQTAIAGNILDQMKERMAAGQGTYWIESEFPDNDFHSITADQNFFFSDGGNIVIRFDEYEVAPGSEGCPQFEIPKEVYEQYLN